VPLKVMDVIEIMENFAPVDLKESYDNVGLMVGDRNSTVTSILVALDCTLDVIAEAKERNCNLILTHHPLIFRKPSSVTYDTLQGRKINELIKNDISVYSSHTNLDSVCGGINDIFLKVLGFPEGNVMEPAADNKDKGNSGIGRFVVLEEGLTLGELCSKVKGALQLEYIRYSGQEDRTIKRIALINGSGQDYFITAAALGADCIITGDTTYHYVSDYIEEGISVIDAGHFATEWPAFRLFADILSSALTNSGWENSVITSSKTKDPYKYK
jgi:dinuclear metal center YbgI/SA1388 family protein